MLLYKNCILGEGDRKRVFKKIESLNVKRRISHLTTNCSYSAKICCFVTLTKQRVNGHLTAGFLFSDVAVKYPKFSGTGYMAFAVLRGAFKEFTVDIEFRPDKVNGLLLFSSDHPDARSDFFSVTLVNGHVEFR